MAKAIIIPCIKQGSPSTHKIWVGNGVGDDSTATENQEKICAEQGIKLSREKLDQIERIRKVAMAKKVSFEDLVLFSFMVLAKREKRLHSEAEQAKQKQGK